jgi:hypothetical protein
MSSSVSSVPSAVSHKPLNRIKHVGSPQRHGKSNHSGCRREVDCLSLPRSKGEELHLEIVYAPNFLPDSVSELEMNLALQLLDVVLRDMPIPTWEH